MRFDSARPAVQIRPRPPYRPAHLTPTVRKRSRARWQRRMSCAHGPQTTAGQAGSAYALRPATNDCEPGGTRVRLAPTGHEPPRAKRHPRTACAHGPQTTANQAAPGYGSRPRATNEHEPGGTRVRLAPTVHKRPRAKRHPRTPPAHGPRTTASQAAPAYVTRPRANNAPAARVSAQLCAGATGVRGSGGGRCVGVCWWPRG